MGSFHEFSVPYWVGKVDGHDEYQDTILELIEQSPAAPIENEETYEREWVDDNMKKTQIAKGDFYVNNPKPEYAVFLFEETGIREQMEAIMKDLGYKGINVDAIWFQQYYGTDTHSWHIHNRTHWACVYYVELPDDAPPTTLLDPVSKETIEPDVSEGDLLIFPGQVLHTSPPNESDDRKTVIAFNMVCSGACHPPPKSK